MKIFFFDSLHFCLTFLHHISKMWRRNLQCRFILNFVPCESDIKKMTLCYCLFQRLDPLHTKGMACVNVSIVGHGSRPAAAHKNVPLVGNPTGLKGNLRLNLTCSERLMLVLLHYTSEYTVCCLLYLISPT